MGIFERLFAGNRADERRHREQILLCCTCWIVAVLHDPDAVAGNVGTLENLVGVRHDGEVSL